MPRLLVSVRSKYEAEEALAGGADVIDVKEPDSGPLGKARDSVCAEILGFVAGRRPAIAALAELLNAVLPCAACPFPFVKWGLAHCAPCKRWRAKAMELAAALSQRLAACTPVFVAYAEHASANAPPIKDVARWCID